MFRNHYRWFIIFLMFISTIINYLDRAALSYAIEPIQKAFSLNNASFGMVAAAFSLGYMVMTLIGGICVDRFGARKIWSIAAVLWSFSFSSIGLCNHFFCLFSARLALGLTEGPAFPALTRAITDWVPMKERGRAFALSLSAIPFASVIGAPLISGLIIYFQWRITFIILGLIGVVWAILWWYFFQDQPEQSQYVSDIELKIIREQTEKKLSEKHFLLNPILITNTYAYFTFGYSLFFALNWLPGFFQQTYGMALNRLAIFLILPWLLGAVFILLGGIISDHIWKKTQSIRAARSHLIWICQLLSALCYVAVIFSSSIKLVLFFMSFAIAFGLMPNAAFYALHADIAKKHVATSLGVMTSLSATSGFLSPFLTGWLSEVTGNFNSAIYLLVFLSITSALAVIIFQKEKLNK